ncbi:hypothetical protein DCC77_01005 [Candidatus Uhrbacteria bacterium]|nr:MAG: hypothetical protein DCC77_01005 [Candidatus Uhrbacteria bacterium]
MRVLPVPSHAWPGKKNPPASDMCVNKKFDMAEAVSKMIESFFAVALDPPLPPVPETPPVDVPPEPEDPELPPLPPVDVVPPEPDVPPLPPVDEVPQSCGHIPSYPRH